jgi:hypothetical protein
VIGRGVGAWLGPGHRFPLSPLEDPLTTHFLTVEPLVGRRKSEELRRRGPDVTCSQLCSQPSPCRLL